MAKSAQRVEPSPQKRGRVSQTDVPRHTLDEALRVATVLSDQFGKKPTKPFRAADALDMSPTSSRWRTLTGASIAYGLTTGGYNAPEIALTALGRRIVAPTVEGDDLAAKREAFLKPRVVRAFLEQYNDNPLPSERIGRNVLESDYGVAADATARTLNFILEGARSLGLAKDIKDKTYVDLDGVASDASSLLEAVDDGEEPPSGVEAQEEARLTTPPSATTPPDDLTTNRRVFITHGRNKKIVEQIKELLTFGSFEPVVSVERESVSKPVPEKVLDDMRSCAAAVIHVGTEQRLLDETGSEHRVINSNVLIEIGAAMMRYGGKFILLVEEGTTLPSNLQGLYEVRYSGNELDYPATMKLLKAFNEFKS
ncbi:MAG TPA: TIR domain-containing protein [Solirubrobacteraceae bacterium]|jgi:predicted nucleotide-binding protein|nr:TIR domain-containing protein [Solirubrobacteraceae bacterium]